jgi:phenylacetate-CoA ligase
MNKIYPRRIKMFLRKLYFLKNLKRQDRLSPVEREKRQLKYLKALIRHCYTNVPFYRRIWKKNEFNPKDFNELKDIRKIPVITRGDVSKNHSDFIAVNYRQYYDLRNVKSATTSGTTRPALTVLFDNKSFDFLEAKYLYSIVSAGCGLREPIYYYWHEPFERRLHNRLGFLNKIRIRTELSEEEQIEMILKTRPKHICHLSSSLYSIAKKMLQKGERLNTKVIITQGEILTPNMRKCIKKAFSVDPYDRYATAEFGIVGWECDYRNAYHVDQEGIVLEVLKDDENIYDERGQVVITGLMNFLFPLVRYSLGDIAVQTKERCDCGSTVPMIKKLCGRNLIKVGKKRTFTEDEIIDSVAHIPEIYKFKVVYKGKKNFDVQLVLFDSSKKVLKEINNRLRGLLGKGIKINYKIIDDIEKRKTGKRIMVDVKGG